MNTYKLSFFGGWAEISYYQTIQLPDVVTPEVPAVLDEDGNEVTPAVPETTTPGGTQSVVLQCTSYHPTQLELIHADCAKHGVTIEGDDAQAIAEWVANYIPPDPIPAPIPHVVSIRQAKMALHTANLLDDIDAAVMATGRLAQIEWEYATEVRRNHPLIAMIQVAKGLTDEEIDTLFVSASLL